MPAGNQPVCRLFPAALQPPFLERVLFETDSSTATIWNRAFAANRIRTWCHRKSQLLFPSKGMGIRDMQGRHPLREIAAIRKPMTTV